MYRIKDKEQVIREYSTRYPELDNIFIRELGKEYDRYVNLLRNADTHKEALEIFENEIQKNEIYYKDNASMKCLEGSAHNQYMEILANYGLIVFFRDHMIE